MTKPKTKKTGLPKALEAELDELPEQTMEEFIQQMHGETGPTQTNSDMPSLEWLKSHYKTKSAMIRYLVSQTKEDGSVRFQIKDIAKHLGIRYQMVRNVATNPLKRGPNEDWRPPGMRKEPTHD